MYMCIYIYIYIYKSRGRPQAAWPRHLPPESSA